MSLQLALDVSRAGPTTVVAVRGELDLASAPELTDLLGRLLGAGAIDVAVDLGDIDFVDSHGLDAVAAAADRFARAGGGLRVARPPRLARILLTSARLAERLPIVDPTELSAGA